MDILKKGDLVVDFGTANCVIIKKGKGIVLEEPTVVAISPKTKKVKAVGQEAKEMLGKESSELISRRPMKEGGISNYRLAIALLRNFLKKSNSGFLNYKPKVTISTPAGISSVEQRALVKALKTVGVKEINLFPEPMAAAIGAGIPVDKSKGRLVINLGGGTAEIAIISSSAIVNFESHKGVGDLLNQEIRQYIKDIFNLDIGEYQAESIKIAIGSALDVEDPIKHEIKGKDMNTGMLKSIHINTNDLVKPIQQILDKIIEATKRVIINSSPEIGADILDIGGVMTGGSSLLRNIDKYFSFRLQIPVYKADDPLKCVVIGMERA